MIKWKSVQLIAENFTTYEASPEHPRLSGDEILRRIMRLPKKEPISFFEGFRKAITESLRLRRGGEVEPGLWISRNWPDWLNQQGYHVELVGGEYEVVPGDEPTKEVDSGPQPIQLTMRVGDHFLTLLTLSTRPPIKGVKVRADQKLEILYETGEVESAFKTAEERGYVVSGIFPGKIEIQAFHWAS
jgi:hypothetical protein